MKIGYRTVKTAIGTPIAIIIAQYLGLSNFTSAGILTILTIKPSRKQSVISAWHRLLACIVASVFAFVFFEFVGYHPVVLAIMLIFFIPVTVLLKVTPGIATSSVIILNLYSAGDIPIQFLLEQFVLIFVGIGTGLLVNLYMPGYDRKLKQIQKKLEDNFQLILTEIALYIRDKNTVWNGKELRESDELLHIATDLVEIDKENHLLRSEHTYYDYFYMRQKQLDLLRKMLPLVTKLPNQDEISLKIANFFDGLAESVHPGNTAIVFLEQLKELREDFNKEDLPTTREEFETRANLFRLLHEIENYLIIKKRYKESDVSLLKRAKAVK
ncbi:aromatic acid exporter family protein [Ornithinibacillus californiensis]|uniref:aromatic acid exporter family protein n=1 Tax=Ornithinibacillus californiensis TaxID=161536 RepID=UPI00064DF593|nr:aromatic acid exporter family protein [Ornithinibacillus californiensis]